MSYMRRYSWAFAPAVILLSAFLAPNSLAFNWPWDQGHDCVQGSDGSGGWGKYDYEGVFRGSYYSKECCQALCKICPVYAKTGAYQQVFTDLSLPGTGLGIEISRTYNSQEWGSGLFGRGWIFNFGRKLVLTRNKAGQTVVGVILASGEKNFFRQDADGSLTPLLGMGKRTRSRAVRMGSTS